MKAKRKFVFIRWLDHCGFSSGDWHTSEEVKKLSPAEMIPAGWLLDDKKDCIIIAAHTDYEGMNVGGEMCIMKNSIIKKWFVSDPTA